MIEVRLKARLHGRQGKTLERHGQRSSADRGGQHDGKSPAMTGSSGQPIQANPALGMLSRAVSERHEDYVAEWWARWHARSKSKAPAEVVVPNPQTSRF